MRYLGEDYVIDTVAFSVERAGARVDLEPQAMDLLLFMLARPDELLTKVELLTEVWGDQFVSESALTTRIKQVRRALGDDGRAQRIIQTVHGRGYKFIGALTEIPDGDTDGTEQSAGRRESSPDGRSEIEQRVHNLPNARTELIGRADLMADTILAVESTRLVSLIGIGGAGKTALAQEVGRRTVGQFTDGVWFVDLIPATDADDIDLAVARSIGLQLGSGATRTQLLAQLSDRSLLLILDNCEHVVDLAAELCGELLDQASEITLLTTSREPLRLVGERRITVGPLPMIGDDGGALDLLRLVAARYGVSIPEADQLVALNLCNRIDGLPLAIELVGAQLSVLSVAEIVERLDRITGSDARDRRPDRHASLATILSDTVAALAADERKLLTVLARIEGSFAVADVEALSSSADIVEPTARFAALIDRSLLVTTEGEQRRYALLETVRQHMAASDPMPKATDEIITDWLTTAAGRSIAHRFYDMNHAQWVVERYDDIVGAIRRLIESNRYEEAGAIISSTALAMHLDDGSRASHMLELLTTMIEQISEPVLASQVHCCGVMAAMAARVPSEMHEHGLRAVETADDTDDISLQGLARVMRSWAGVVVDPTQALVDLDDAIELANQVDDDETALIATGYKVFHLAMGLRFDEAIQTGYSAYTQNLEQISYPRRVVSSGLVCCLVIDDPQAALAIDADAQSGMASMSFWGTAIMRATAHAALGATDNVRLLVRNIETRLERAGISPLPDLLLVPAALAHQAGDADRAARYIGAVRASEQPTQSLMVSTGYRAMRQHIKPSPTSELDESTEQTWQEARDWMGVRSPGPTVDRR